MNHLHTAIVLVNWNSWEDTIRCISACRKLEEFSGPIFIVDNCSTDNSFELIGNWLTNQFVIPDEAPSPEIKQLEKPIISDYFRFISGDEEFLTNIIDSQGCDPYSIFLVNCMSNLGFGAGNNVGIRLAMRMQNVDLIWCLNTDAIPKKDCLKELEYNCLGMSKPILSGSVLLEYTSEQIIQTVGSDFSKFSLRASYKYAGQSVSILDKLPERFNVDYPIGASLVLNRSFIENYGMYDERYFLYYEEPDLALRLRGMKPFICTRSLVYHKGGQTTGSGKCLKDRGGLADYHYNRSRAILASKLSFVNKIGAVLASIYSIFRRLYVGRPDLAVRVVPAVLDGFNS